MDLAKEVTVSRSYSWTEGSWQLGKGHVTPAEGDFKYHVVAYDFGVAQHTAHAGGPRLSPDRGAGQETPAAEVLAMNPDGIFLSNGPGDPRAVRLRHRRHQGLPGHQHPGVRHLPGPPVAGSGLRRQDRQDEVRPPRCQPPVKSLDDNTVMITAQNHGFAVDENSLPDCLRATHVSLFDGSPARQSIAPTARPSASRGPEASPARTTVPVCSTMFCCSRYGVEIDQAFCIALKRGHKKKPCQNVTTTEHPDSGRRPHRHRSGLRIRLLRRPGVKALKKGYRVILVNSNPATIMTDPEMADATYIEPSPGKWCAKSSRKSARMPSCPPWVARRLNCALALEQHGVLAEFGVEMIGATADAIDKAEDRSRLTRPCKIGLDSAARLVSPTTWKRPGRSRPDGFCIIRPSFTMGGSGGHRLQPAEEFVGSAARPGSVADQGTAHRRVAHRLERVRDGGGAGSQRQLHHRLFHRELRPDGHPHRGLHHGRAPRR